jgi:ADP-ribose pyrophosphatase YjhB (NUDIX family)
MVLLSMALSRFNVRVYGICFNHNAEVLLTDERRSGFRMTKFPGGGLEYGEGIADCLQREFREELSLEVALHDLVYINDFLQVSAFNPNDQILSVYYLVRALMPSTIPVEVGRYAFPESDADAQTFRWANPTLLAETDLSFPIDRVVLRLLQQRLANQDQSILDLIAASMFG